MIATLLWLLAAQTPVSQPPPVRVWLGPASVASGDGDQWRVYVHTTSDGHLVVLDARPDGRVEVLFPADPANDPFVRAGTYEIRVPAEMGLEGRGTVVAALSPDPVWFDEFVHRSEWDGTALSGDAADPDPEAMLTDIVQRMLGDGSFNYDVAAYDVAPRLPAVAAVAETPPPAVVCAECSLTNASLIVTDLPLRVVPHRRRRGTPRAVARGRPAPAPAPTPAAIAVYSVHRPVGLALLPPAAPTTFTIHDAVPLVARARPAAAQAAAATARARLLERVVHAARAPGLGPVPEHATASPSVGAGPTRGAVPLVAAPAPRGFVMAYVAVAPAVAVVAPPVAPHLPVLNRPATAPVATGVGLSAVHTAGWRH